MYNTKLYEQVLNKKHHSFRQQFNKEIASDFTNPEILPVTRMAMRLRDVFKQEKAVILEGQKIVFIRTITDVPSIFDEEEWDKIKSQHYIHELGYFSNGCPCYDKAISIGLDKSKEQILLRLEQAQKDNDVEGAAFLQAAAEQIDSIFYLTDKYIEEAKAQNRRDVVELLTKVPHKKAESFIEALQFFRILHYTLWAEGEYHNTVGRFDQYMYPYLKNDLEKGVLTEEQAQELLEEFFMSFNWDNDKYVGIQLGDNGQSMMLGGCDTEGNDAYNILSQMCLRASCELKLIDPKINLRVSKDTPFERYQEGTYLTKAGLGFPQYSNDDIVIPGLVDLGYELEDARNYSVAACWEFILPGEADIVNIDALSYPKIVEQAMFDHLEHSETFDEFMGYVRKGIFEESEIMLKKYDNLYFIPAPFYSTLMPGCVENAKDISLGGKYNNYGIHGTGIATAADSLESIRTHIFDKKDISKKDMLEAVKNDFKGFEEILHTCRFEDAKMGDNIDSVDNIASTIIGWHADSVKGKKNQRGGIFRTGSGSAMYYLWHANEINASADGRRKGEPFGANYSPSIYVKSKGPFSVIQSFAKPPLQRAINGGPLTMEFHSTIFDTDEGIDQVAKLVKQYIDLGGHQLQLNSINRQRLLDAQKHPENYTNLIVRIWGWSAYFVELDKEYQDHLILRQEFNE
ncbi:MAG: pyruvate formate-lyase [Clostridiales bacterium]|nr:pyruvate formate-lyase [Clostridiales bacterium]